MLALIRGGGDQVQASNAEGIFIVIWVLTMLLVGRALALWLMSRSK